MIEIPNETLGHVNSMNDGAKAHDKSLSKIPGAHWVVIQINYEVPKSIDQKVI